MPYTRRPLLHALFVLILGLVLSCGLAAQQDPDTPADDAAPQVGYGALADILEDDAAREALIEDLRRRAAETEEATDAEAETEQPPESVARRIAAGTQGFAEGLVAEVGVSWGALEAAGRALRDADPTTFGLETLRLGSIILATVLLFLLLRRLIRPLFLRMGDWAVRSGGRSPLLRRAVAVLGAALTDLGIIAAAWLGGYLLALFAIAPAGSLDTHHSLFLNAFFAVEAAKAVIRLFFSSRYDALRLLPLTGEVAAYWNAWIARLSGFIGYGILFVVPIITQEVARAAGRLTAVLIMLMAFLYALTIILQNRAPVRRHLENRAAQAHFAFSRVLLGMAGRVWHLVAIAYIGALLLVTLIRPEDALPFMAMATVQTLIAIAGGVFAAIVISQIVGRSIRVPDETRQRYPMLEERLNAFIPTTLRIVRIVIGIVVVAVVLDAWQLFDIGSWLVSDAGIALLSAAVSVGLIVLVATALWIGLATWVESRLDPEARGGEPGAREKTLLTLFRNAAAIVIVVLAVMVALSELGVNIGPLIAGAGVVGLAVGFGAQKLVQDVITGVFIQLENAINVGDIVTAAGVTGTTERLTIRSLGLRDLSGTYHLIPFSSVDNVANYTREFAYHVGEYGIAYREDIDAAMRHLQAAFDELRQDPELGPRILDDLELSGVVALADSSVNIRVRIMTEGGHQWAVGRAYNRLVKRHFDAAGIEIPFPHRTLYFGEDKSGKTPPARIEVTDKGSDGEAGAASSGTGSESPGDAGQPSGDEDSAGR